MRVYVPSKEEDVINEILKDLYMLKKAIDYNTGAIENRIHMVDEIRNKVRTLLEEEKEGKGSGS
jgi:DNA polymerase sigma